MDLSVLLASAKDWGIFAAVLSVLIVVHEWGHFMTAKKMGVNVERFSLGFGPKLFSKMYKGTEFLVCLIPLGGYVKMAGDERNHCQGTPDEFYSQPPGRRSLIVLNGPVINFVLAYICLVFVFMLGYPDISTKIGEVIGGSPAHQVGLKAGDEIIKVDSQDVYGWMELDSAITRTQKDQVDITVVREGQAVTMTVVPQTVVKKDLLGQERKVKDIGIEPFSNIVGEVGRNSPAQKAGLQSGDKIIKIDSKRIGGWTQLHDAVANSKGDTIAITLIRDGRPVKVKIIPKIITVKDKSGQDKKIRQIGVSPHQDLTSYRFGFVESIGKGFQKLADITVLTYRAIYRMVTGGMSAKENMTGPVGIFYIVKAAADMGFSHLLYIVGIISASLAIFNLLPIIPLDGGHLLLLGIEKVRGRALSAKADETIARIGFTIIICLALFVFYSDFDRLGWIEKARNLWR